MVNEYKQQCGYEVGTLKPYIYIIPKESLSINYKVDNDKVNVIHLSSESIYKINGSNVLLTNEETIEGRFKFESTITINIHELIDEPWFYALGIMRNEKFFVIIENMEGQQFIQAVDFPSQFTYNYTFSSASPEANSNELTFKCNSNIPTLIIDEPIKETQTLIHEKCAYNIGSVNNLKLCNFRATYIKKDTDYRFTEIFTNGDDRFQDVEFNKTSFSFTEQYSNNSFTDTLTFTIPLSKYKYIFHYNLIEFKKNRYAITFTTNNGVTVAAGFEFGFFPSYTIQTSEEVNTPNTITITLKHVGEEPLLYSSSDVPFKVDTSSVRTPLLTVKNLNNEDLSTILCINDTQAIYTLVREYTVTGIPLNRYWCYEGYENTYYWLNIVGTYNAYDDYGKTLIFNSATCATQQDCQILKGLPIQIVFEKINQTFTYPILATCDWVLSELPPYISADVKSGKANQEVNVTFTALRTPTASGDSATITLTSGSDYRITTLILQNLSDWLSPLSIKCDARPQTVNSFLLNGTTSNNVNIVNSGGATVSFQQGTVNILVPANDSETITKTYNITLHNTVLNQSKTIEVVQDHIYVELRWLSDTAYVCDGRNSYKLLTKFIGYSPTTINIQTGETEAGELINENDPKCVATMSRWINTNNTMCSGSSKYKVQEEEISYDYGATWEKSGKTRPGEIIEYNSPDCSGQYTWVYENNNVCLNGNLYKQYVKYYNNGTTLVPTGETKLGEVIEVQSPECMADEDNSIQYTFVYDTLITNTIVNNLKILSDTNFSVNWGDGTTNNYLSTDYGNLKAVNHIWSKSSSNTKKSYTVIITGGIREIRLEYPEQYQSSGWFYTAFNIDKGINLRKFYVEHTKLSTVDLTHNRRLINFEMIDNYHASGLRTFTFPQSIQLQYIHIGNKSAATIGYITASQLQTILDGLPQYDGVKRGLVDFCWNTSESNVNQTCGLDYSALDTKNWFKSLPCCANLGSVRYQEVASTETRCGDNYELWSLNKLQQSSWVVGESGTGSWSDWVDVTPPAYLLNDVIATDSPACGYEPKETYKWELTGQISCDGTTSYFMEQQFVSDDDGVTWKPVEPAKLRPSTTKKQDEDPDCGYIPPSNAIYRFVDVIGQYLCDEEDTNCLIENAWIPIGFTWNSSNNGGSFSNKTISTVPTICDGEKLYTGENLFSGLQLVKTFPSFNTANMESMKLMFDSCISMVTYPSITSAKVKTMERMFYGCTSLASVEFDNTEQVTNMNYMFSRCKNLVSVKGINLIRCFNIQYMFDSTAGQYNNLVTVEIKNCNVDLDMKTCFKLSHESLTYIIDNSIGDFSWYIPKSRADLLTEAERIKAASKGIYIIVN